MDIKNKENEHISLQPLSTSIQSPNRKQIHNISPKPSLISLNNTPLADITLSKKSSFNQLTSTPNIYSDKSPSMSQHSNNSRSPSPKRASPLPKKLFSKLQKATPVIYGDEEHISDNDEIFSITNKYTKLERMYADQMLKNSQLIHEQERLEKEILDKEQQILANFNKLSILTHSNQKLNEKLTKQHELNEREIINFREIKYNLQRKIQSLQKIILDHDKTVKSTTSMKKNNILDNDFGSRSKSPSAFHRQYNSNSIDIDESMDATRLLKDYKLLLTNHELEKNSKLILIDQIELLTKENSKLIEQFKVLEEKYNTLLEENQHLKHDFSYNDDLTDLNIHSSNISKIDQEESENQNNQIPVLEMKSLAEELLLLERETSGLDHSIDSPSLPNTDSRNNSLYMENEFKFPADTDHITPNRESKSNTLKISTEAASKFPGTPTLDEQLHFSLSPFKLSSLSPNLQNSNNYSNSNSTSNSETRPTRGHSRYNSLDLLPIKVEFQEKGEDSTNSYNNKRIESINEENSFIADSSAMYFVFPGSTEPTKKSLEHSSSTSKSSSKRNSLVLNHTTPKEELQKQEIVKLKFELQSLKLHNEKLLSYIGFQLQNDVKQTGKDNFLSKIEYSDAKLIQNSIRLIHKKRILRSVSINPIMSKEFTPNNSKKIGLQNNLINSSVQNDVPCDSSSSFLSDKFITAIDEDSSFENIDEDEYGFLNTNQSYGKRIFSNGLYKYLECEKPFNYKFPPIEMKKKRNEIKIDQDSKVKKSVEISSNEKISIEEDEVSEDSCSESEDSKLVEEEQNQTLLKHIKSIKEFISTSNDENENDGLKYKFLSIAIGILIIGLKFHSNHYYVDIRE